MRKSERLSKLQQFGRRSRTEAALHVRPWWWYSSLHIVVLIQKPRKSKKRKFPGNAKTHYTNFKNSPVETADTFFNLQGCFYSIQQFFFHFRNLLNPLLNKKFVIQFIMEDDFEFQEIACRNSRCVFRLTRLSQYNWAIFFHFRNFINLIFSYIMTFKVFELQRWYIAMNSSKSRVPMNPEYSVWSHLLWNEYTACALESIHTQSVSYVNFVCRWLVFVVY